MEQQNTRLRNAGFATFFFSGICAISAGVVVSLLQERYGFAYGMTGTLLSLMSIGNLLAGLLMGMLPSALGMKRSVLLLTIGYAAGYAVMGLTGAVALLAVAFFVVGIAKGSVINTCTILVSDHSADRTRGMNLMHSCYACGALLCPFLIAAAGRVSTGLALLVLAALGVLVWLIYLTTPMDGQGSTKSKTGKEKIDWSFLHSVQFWLLTGLLFCQNAAEQSVTGWMVTYFKGSGIIAGSIDPFACYITAQNGTVMNEGRTGFTPEQILHMDWLCDAVEGHLPEFDELIDCARPMYRMQGIHRDRLPAEKEADL